MTDPRSLERTLRIVGLVFMVLNALLALFGVCTGFSRNLLLSLIGIGLSVAGVVVGLRAWRQPVRPYPKGTLFGLLKPQGLPTDPMIEPGWTLLSALCFVLGVCFL